MAKFELQLNAEEINRRLLESDAKFGAFHIDPSTMTFYYFKDQEDKQKFLDGDTSVVLDSEKFDMSNKIQQIKIVNDMGSTILYFTTQEESNVISVGFISQEKDFGDDEFTEVYENAYFTVDVDKSNKGEWVTIVDNQRVVNGEKFSVDVKNYLATGPNKVRIKCTGEQSEKSTTMLFTANVTTMYLKASNFGWHLPFIEGNPFKLGGMLIGGSIDKVLNIRISNENNYAASYKVPLGTATHTINPYDYNDLPFPTEGGTGVYHVELWLDSNGLESDHLKYNIMCVAAADQYTAQLAVMNSSLSKIVNYAENKVFEYSCYNAGGTTAAPYLKLQSIIGTVPTVLVDGPLGTVETAKAQSYTYQPEIESWEEGMQLQAILTNGNEQTIIFPIDNSLSYPAISGASFYLQPSSRNNTQDDREMIINKADHSYWQAYWENMAWKDGIDGWTTDASGEKCLFLPAGSSVEIQMQPMKTLTNKTIDLVFKVNNISDYNTPVFSICDDPSSDNFNGIVVYADRVVVYTNDQKSTLVQSRNFREGVKQSMQIVYANNYKGVGNTVTIYQNGVGQCEFQYETKDLVTNNGFIRMGGASCDLYIYPMRIYERALAWPDCAQNWIASLRTTEEKQAAMENLMKCVDDSFNMSFDAVVAAGFDYMTIEMTEGKIPSYVNQAAGKCNVELKVKGWWDTVTKFLNIPIEGQGTTAMNYWLWNLRLKLSILAFFAGKWTGKINYASGMQNHKMSATDAYDEIYHYIGLANEVDGPVAVKQKPVVAFEKKLVDASTGLYSYEFIGLYTFGPDKGNDAYFKFDDERFADKVIYLEGMDHNVKGAGYDYPYDKLSYKASAEAICNNGGEAALEVRKCGNAEEEADIQAKLDEKFKPLYEFAYNNNPLIKGTDATLEQMNADVEAWGKQSDADGHKFERFEFWVDGVYDVLYLDKAENKYKSNGINLLTQLGMTEDDLAGLTIEEKNQLFIDARVARFKASAADYIDVRDYMYKIVFCIIFFASDNGIKNTYTYLLEDKWRQLQDDLDSIFKSDNQSLFSKEFWQEMSDFANANKSSYAFKGEHNVLEQLLRMAFPDVEKEMAHKVLDAMVELSPYGDNTIEKLMGYLQSRSWDKAQGYFPKSAYNNFTALAYEGAWPAYIGKSTVSYTVDVNPLSQVVGDSLETEMNFMYFRLIYVMSKYAYGPFANYDDKCLGQITWRTQATQSLTLTPAFPLYPAALSGQTGKRNANRRYMAGESVTFDGLGGSNTNVYVAGADCLEDVGDLSDIIVDSETDATLQISAKRLKRLKVGDEVEASSNIGRLMLTSTPSLETLDARNLKNLASDVDLSNSPRLREALLAGSVSTGVSLKRGQKIKVLSLPATITSLELLDLPNLADENLTIEGVGNVTFLRLENCKGVDMFELLKTIYKTEGNKLTNIRIVGFVYDGTAEDIDMLAHFANDTDADGNERVYNGIDADGKTDTLNIPVIEGILNLDGYVYEETAQIVRANYPNLVFQPLGYYVAIKDPKVLEILLANITTDDGIGLTVEDVEGVTSIGTWFQGNTVIETFNELERFDKVTLLSTETNNYNGGAFYGCTSLQSIKLPTSITKLLSGTFYKCSALSSIEGLENITHLYNVVFGDCSALRADLYFPSLTTMQGAPFKYSGITGFIAPLLASIPGDNTNNNAPFSYCVNLKKVSIPKVTSIGANAFAFCSALESLSCDELQTLNGSAFYKAGNFAVRMPNLTSMGARAFKESGVTEASFGKLETITGNSYDAGAFQKCTSLVKVDLTGVKTIQSYAFDGCSALTTIVNASVLTSIAGAAFNGIGSADISFPALKVLEGTSVFRNSGIVRVSSLGELESIPSGAYNGGVFQGCTKLEYVDFPESLTSIGAYAFDGCELLKDLDFTNVKSIGHYAFRYTAQKDLVAPSLESIGASFASYQSTKTQLERVLDLGKITTLHDGTYNVGAFNSCKSLRIVIFPETLTSLGTEGNVVYCTALETVICKATTPPTYGSNFYGSGDTFKVFVPLASLEDYKAATGWSGIASRIFPIEYIWSDYPDLYEEVGDYLGLGNAIKFADPAVEAICLANYDTDGNGVLMKSEAAAVTDLGAKFKGNTTITSFMELAQFGSVNILTNEEFKACSNLESIDLSNIKNIGKGAFTECSNLTNYGSLENVEILGDYAFNGTAISGVLRMPKLITLNGVNGNTLTQTNITEIADLGRITDIPAYFFCNSSNLEKVNIPDSVISIQRDAFATCPKLKTLIIGEGIESIAKGILWQCTAIKSIVCKAVTPPLLAEGFVGTNSTFSIYVPDESLSAYQNATNWSTYMSRIFPLSQLEEE